MRQFAEAGRPSVKGEELLGLLQGHRLEGFERSFKMSPATVLADRFLAGIHKADLSPLALRSICERMGMPQRFRGSMGPNAEAANAFHFGFEASGTGGIYKVYLEFAGQLPAVADDAGLQRTVLLYLAYKWDALDPQVATIARYECFPGLSMPALARRIEALYRAGGNPGAMDSMREILELAAGRTGVPPMYLEVTEENTPRASFDVNFHNAALSLEGVGPWIDRQRERLRIPAGQFAPVYAGALKRTLGHISGGINREGREFLTVYYAAEAP